MENEEKETCLRYLPLAKDHFKMFTFLTNEQTGLLIKLIGEYFYGNKSFEDIEKNISNDDKIILPVIANVKENLDRAMESYNKKCEQNRKNGKKGGEAKAQKNARKKKDNEPPEIKAQENVKSNSTEEESDYIPEGEDWELDIRCMRDMLDKMQSELSIYNTSLFKLFAKSEATRFLAIWYLDIDYKNIFGCWYNSTIGFLEDVRNMGVNNYLKEFEKYVRDQELDNIKDMTVDKFAELFKYYKRVASSVVEEYLKQLNA